MDNLLFLQYLQHTDQKTRTPLGPGEIHSTTMTKNSSKCFQ